MKQQDHNTPRIIRKIGKTTYLANSYFNENATEKIDDKIKQKKPLFVIMAYFTARMNFSGSMDSTFIG